MPRFHDVIIDETGSLQLSGVDSTIDFLSGSVLNLGENGGSSGYLDVWSSSAVRMRDTSTLLFISGSMMRGTVDLDTGLTISDGDLNLGSTASLNVADGGSIDVLGAVNINASTGILSINNSLFVNATGHLYFVSGSKLSGTVILDTSLNIFSGTLGLGASAILNFTSGAKLTGTADLDTGLTLTGGDLDLNTVDLTVASDSTTAFNNTPLFSNGAIFNEDVTVAPTKAINYSGAGRSLFYDSVVMYPVWFQNSSDPGSNWQFVYGSEGASNDRCYWESTLLTEDSWDAIFYIQIPVSAVELLAVRIEWYGGTWDTTPANPLILEVVISESGSAGQQYSAAESRTLSAGAHAGYQAMTHSMGGGQSVTPADDTVCVRVKPPEINTGEGLIPLFRLLSLRAQWSLGTNEPG